MTDAEKSALRMEGQAEMVAMAAARKGLTTLILCLYPGSEDANEDLDLPADAHFVSVADSFFEGKGLKDSMTRTELTKFGRRSGSLGIWEFGGLHEKQNGREWREWQAMGGDCILRMRLTSLLSCTAKRTVSYGPSEMSYWKTDGSMKE